MPPNEEVDAALLDADGQMISTGRAYPPDAKGVALYRSTDGGDWDSVQANSKALSLLGEATPYPILSSRFELPPGEIVLRILVTPKE
jgi:hypothetical protein